jgi:pimeloyl-ACP methyl ester carboxylesterase
VIAALLLLAALPVAHRRVVASDGAALALHRYGDATGGGVPVLMIPDLGLTRAVFDLEGEGLARYLAAAGRTVYVAELRGRGSLGARVSRDLPAIAKVIGAPQVDLVAHGWAGTLALVAAKQLGVRRVVAIATPVYAEVPSPIVAAVLKNGGAFTRLVEDAEGARALELLFTFGGRFKPGRLEALRAFAFSDLGAVTSRELLQWMTVGDFTFDDGSTVLTRLAQYDRPTLLFNGLADGFASPELCVPLKGFSKAEVTLRTFSRFELASEDYSHLSLLQGRGARVEVYEPARGARCPLIGARSAQSKGARSGVAPASATWCGCSCSARSSPRACASCRCPRAPSCTARRPATACSSRWCATGRRARPPAARC